MDYIGNTQTTTAKGAYRPTSDDIVKAIKATKRGASRVNKKHDNAIAYLILGILLAIASQVFLPSEFTFFTFDMTSNDVSVFEIVFSLSYWASVKLGIFKSFDVDLDKSYIQ